MVWSIQIPRKLPKSTLRLQLAPRLRAITSKSTSPNNLSGHENDQSSGTEPDFEEEYEKTQKKLNWLYDIISKKELIATLATSTKECEGELERLSPLHAATQADLVEKEEKWSAFAKMHDKRQKEWASFTLKTKAIIFLSDHDNPEMHALDPLQAHVELAEENAALFRERLHLATLKKDKLEANNKLNMLQDVLEFKREGKGWLEVQRGDAITAYEDVILQWNTRSCLKNHPAQLADCPENAEDGASHTEAILKEKDLKINKLEDENQKLREQLKAKNKQLQVQVISNYKKEVIMEVGLDVLRRRQENHKPVRKRNKDIMERGNKAAHYGSPMADALRVLYVDRIAESRKWYEAQYGVTADFVVHKISTNAAAPLFIEIVYWHSAIQHFEGCSVYSEAFMLKWSKFMQTFSGKREDDAIAQWIAKYFTEDKEGIALHKGMKALYKFSYDIHKERRYAKREDTKYG